MTKREELLDYIRNRKYYCGLCHGLQQEVGRRGLIAIDEWDGMICGGVEDMQIRLSEIEYEEKMNKEAHELGEENGLPKILD